jgi:hypothetical protein
MSLANSKSTTKAAGLLDLLRGKRSLLIVMQDNPDPDSIAAAAALRRIANTLTDVQCSIAYGGMIGRGENRAVAGYLGLNFRPMEEIDLEKYDAVALVDTQPRTGNNSLPADRMPDIVLDHHPLRPETRSAAFSDVRKRYGAVSTILVEYLGELGITPDPPLATAQLYATPRTSVPRPFRPTSKPRRRCIRWPTHVCSARSNEEACREATIPRWPRLSGTHESTGIASWPIWVMSTIRT